MTLIQFKNKDLPTEIKSFEAQLEKIILKEVPLRDPSISIIHITPHHIQEAYKQFLLMFRRLKEKYSSWRFETFNIEKTLFDILDKLRYTKKPNFASDCEREELKSDMQSSVKTQLVKAITVRLEEIHKQMNSDDPPPLIFLMNIHSVYPYIQTKDIISRIINNKGISILIPYLQSKLNVNYEHEPYKDANYNVHTVYLA